MTPAAAGLGELLTGHPFPDAEPLISTATRSVSVGDVRAGAAEVAARLRAVAAEPGQAVVVQLPNGPEFVSAMFGVWEAGAVFVPANPRQPSSELDHVLAATSPAAVIDSGGVRASGVAAPTRYAPDTAFVTWTSGTTGRPKPILHIAHGLPRAARPCARPAARAGRAIRVAARPSPNLVPVSLALNAGIYNVLFGLRAGASVVRDGPVLDQRVRRRW